ncbi:MAG: M20/M25/M40 family metallo-hydrolase [Planctomycetota bacterium]
MTYDTDPAVQDLLDLLPVPGEPGSEKAVAELVRAKLREMGVADESMCFDTASERSEIGGEVGNLVVRIEGRGSGERRMLSSHLDTVPGAVGSKPRVEGDRVVNDAPGRCLGADARAGCAVMLAGARRLMEMKGQHPPWTLVFFVQEEIGLVGARWLDVGLLGEPRPSMCFNYDGGDVCEIISSVIGTERMHVEVSGVASHTQATLRGISAAEIFCRAAAECTAGGWHGVVEQSGKKGLANVGVLRGGTGSNVVMPELYALLEARSFDRDFRETILETWRAALRASTERANAERPDAPERAAVSFRQGPIYDPYTLEADHPAVVAASKAVGAMGLEPKLVDDWGGQDTAWITAHGVPAVGMGFGGRKAHTPDEFVDLVEFRRACALTEKLVSAGA